MKSRAYYRTPNALRPVDADMALQIDSGLGSFGAAEALGSPSTPFANCLR
jgi:hypothetical protein